jgi:hypothetical protein
MDQHNTEIKLLKQAIEAFNQTTGIRLRLQRLEPWQAGKRADAELRIETPQGEKRVGAEVKRKLNPHTLGQAIEQIKRNPDTVLLVTEYVNANMAERLKKMEVSFLDATGNAYLNVPPLFIYMTGHKPPTKLGVERPTRAFVPTGLKVVFALLCKQDLVGAPYRTIVENTDVALGTVGWVLYDLRRLDHLLEMGKQGRKLVHKQRLLDHWVTAYPNQLRPKLVIGRYAAPEGNWWQRTQIREFGAYWGGEVAAAHLTRHLKPELVTVYIRDLPGKFLAANRLRKDPAGNIELLKAFWTTACDWEDREIVHPLLAYADLLRTGDPRNIETARKIYDEQLIELVRED